MPTDTVQSLILKLAKAGRPLRDALGGKGAAAAFLNSLGWELPPGIDDIGLTTLDIGKVLNRLDAVLRARADAEASASVSAGGGQLDLAIDVGLYLDLLLAVKDLVEKGHQLASTLPASLSAAGDYVSKTKIDKELVPRVLDLWVMQLVERQSPFAYQWLTLFGIFRLDKFEADHSIFQVEHFRHVVRYDRIALIFSDPRKLFVELYGWGTPGFSAELLITLIGYLLSSLGVKGQIRQLPRRVEERLRGVAVPEADLHPSPQILISFLRGLGWSPLDVGLTIYGLRPTAPGGSDGGLGVFPYVKGSTKFSFDVTESLSFEIDASVDVNGGAALTIRPNAPLQLQTGVTGGGAVATTAAGQLALRLRYKKHGDQRIVLLSFPADSRLDIKEFYLSTGAGMVSGNKLDLFVEAGLMGGRFLLGAGQGDGFLQKILPGGGIKVDFDLIGGWSDSGGVYFRGSSALEISIPAHISLGPIDIESLYFVVRFGADGSIPVESSASVKVALGPLMGTVERIGVTALFSFPKRGGNLGPLDLQLKFKPPNGVALALDVSVVRGGGYLYFDTDREEYAGALELVFSGFLTLKAIGLLNTRMPDGSKGFSLLIIITAEFGTGIQLGFGFTLLAVGGLVGLNRTMRLDALMLGVRTGAINSIMFPKDVIANAPKIISDLRAIFPPEEGKFLIGPMAKIGWGTPTLLSLALGIIIEIPGNIAIVGVLRLALPADDAALLVLQVNFAGAIEFDKKRVYFFAALFESRILFLPIEGEMGLLMAFGDDANFVLSVGGFHPSFSAPPLPFPSPRRVSISLVSSPVSRVRVEGYFAVTSNTVQFGALAEMFYGLDEVNVQGHIAFDALFQFSPFHFIITISASFSMNAFGVGLFSVRISGSLEGPAPWRAKGSGSISLLFFDISADFDVTWGESRDTTLPPIAVMPMFKSEFEKGDNWRAMLPAASNLLVTLRKMPAEEAAHVLHPVGVLRITQRMLPLGLKLDKVGNQKPNDVNRLSVAVSGGGLTKRADTFEQFAPAQFQDMADGDKLSRPAFGPERAGLDLSAAGQELRSSHMVKRVVRYEEIIIDSNFKRFVRRFFMFSGALFNFFLNGASVAKSDLSQAVKKQFDPFEEKIIVQAETYTVAFQSNNKAYAAGSAVFASEASARDFMAQEVAKDAGLAETLHVIPSYESAA
jgi:hypothetical protein